MDRNIASNIKKDIEQALSPYNARAKYIKPQYGKIGYFEVSVDNYYEYADIIADALSGVMDNHSLFFDNDSDADFNLGASWDSE